MAQSSRLPRRRFIQQAGAAAAVGLPALIPSRVLGGPGRSGANDRIGIGFIGCGRRNGQLATGNVGKIPESETDVVGAADVNLVRAEQWAKRHGCTPYQDYRKMLDRKDLDVVIYATPEFWHYLPCIHAAQAGKDIYGEQPLSFTIREGQKMVEAVRRYKRVFQVGEQQRSNPLTRRACELVRNGAIGKVKMVLGANYASSWRCGLPGQPVPKKLDWDVWCGPNPVVPYNKDIYLPRAKPGWMSFMPYCGGELINWGCHGLSLVQWGLDTDQLGPAEIWVEPAKPLAELTYTQPESKDRGNKLCSQTIIHYRFPDGVVLKLDGGDPSGGTFIGSKGKISVYRYGYKCEPKGLDEQPLDLKVKLYKSDNHMQNFFDCVRSRREPIMNIERAHRVCTLCHLGNIARWTGRKLHWDYKTETFPGDDEANAYLDKPRRKPYELPETV